MIIREIINLIIKNILSKMKKKVILVLSLVTNCLIFAQVGINNQDPKTTLDIAAKNKTGTDNNIDGILIPRVDRERAQSMTSVPISTLIYVDNVSTGAQTGIAIDIDAEGFYYFDGIVWIKVISQNNINISEINIYNSNGILTGNRIVAQNDKTLAFTGTSRNAFSIDGTTFSVDANSDRVGIGTTTPNSKLDLGTSFGNDGLTDVNGKKLAVYNNAQGNDFYGLGISAGNLQFHAASTPAEAPAMILNGSGNVGIGGIPSSNAVLELSATNKGFLPPRLTIAQRNAITNASAGLTIYNVDTNCMEFWNSNAWVSTCAITVPPAGSISTITCGSATNNGIITTGTNTSVSSIIPYTGGNNGSHGGQTIASTGVTGLTATLAAGSFANGNGTLTYNITGIPSSMGTASFAINIGGKTCTLTRIVTAPTGPIASLNCSTATNNGTLISEYEAVGVASIISYTGGNGGAHSGQTVSSTGVTGLTATLATGSFANGNGTLTYNITGTPSGTGTANFAINIGGQTCMLTRTVATPVTINCTSEGNFANPNDPRKYYKCVQVGGVFYQYNFTCPPGSLYDPITNSCVAQ